MQSEWPGRKLSQILDLQPQNWGWQNQTISSQKAKKQKKVTSKIQETNQANVAEDIQKQLDDYPGFPKCKKKLYAWSRVTRRMPLPQVESLQPYIQWLFSLSLEISVFTHVNINVYSLCISQKGKGHTIVLIWLVGSLQNLLVNYRRNALIWLAGLPESLVNYLRI